MEGYISISEMAERDKISRRLIKRKVQGGYLERKGKKVFIQGEMRYGEDYVIENGKIYINEKIKIIRGLICGR